MMTADADWPYMRKMHPFVLSTLSLMHDVTPLPESLLRQTGVSVGGLRRHVCEDYRGWPRATALVCDGWARRLEFLSRTIRPPDWWLRLNYGLGTTPMRAWVGSCRHLAALAGIVLRRAGDFLPRWDRSPSDAGPSVPSRPSGPSVQ